MKRYFYFSARFIKDGRMAYSVGILESDEGYFDFVKASKDIAQGEGVDVKKSYHSLLDRDQFYYEG